jgi:tetratricopeptide (TPR) repeat protein
MTDKGSVENVEAFIEIGGDFYEQGAYDEAIFWFDEALAIEPNDIYALINKGVTMKTLSTSFTASFRVSGL